jgi:hypothetical protein
LRCSGKKTTSHLHCWQQRKVSGADDSSISLPRNALWVSFANVPYQNGQAPIWTWTYSPITYTSVLLHLSSAVTSSLLSIGRFPATIVLIVP